MSKQEWQTLRIIPNDPEVIIKIDVCNAFNSSDRAFSLDRINGRASRDYACGLKRGDVIGTVDTLTNLFGYFKAMRTCHSKLRYFDWDGQVHLPALEAELSSRTKGSLNEAVELREREGSSLLLLRDTVLGAESTTSPCIDL